MLKVIIDLRDHEITLPTDLQSGIQDRPVEKGG